MRFTVRDVDSGTALDEYLTQRIRRASKQSIRDWIGRGLVRVNGKGCIPKRPLMPGDEVTVEVPEADLPGPAFGAAMEIPVIYEDDRLVVLDKPAGMPVLPGRFAGEPSVYGELLEQFDAAAGPAEHPGESMRNREGATSGGGEPNERGQTSPVGEGEAEFEAAGPTPLIKPRVVHRIDRETSGLLVVCKDEASSRALSVQFENREVCKTYLALAEGAPAQDAGRIDAAVEPDPRGEGRWREAAADSRGRLPPEAKEAATEWRVRTRWRGYSLLELHPLTGRTHQIRLHARVLGHPLLCDPLYGRRTEFFLSDVKRGYKRKEGEPERPVLARLALHAHALSFRHPTDGHEVSFTSPLPKDLEKVVKLLERHAR